MSDLLPAPKKPGKHLIGCAVGVLLLGLFLALYVYRGIRSVGDDVKDMMIAGSKALGPAGQTAPLPGEQILASYGKPDTRPEEDLSMMAHAFSNLTLLIKGDAPFRMGANEEFAAALRGKNRDRLRLLPDTHPCFNAQGQIVDRWATPLFFHVNDRDHIDIRSAGPDKEMGTPDDLHRRYDGQFLHGEALNSRSLDEAGRSPMAR